MKTIDYGKRGLVTWNLGTCNNLERMGWSPCYLISNFPNGFVKYVSLECILKRSSIRGRIRRPHLHYIWFTVISWVHSRIHPSTRQCMFLHFWMINHIILGYFLSGRSPRYLSISKSSKHFLRLNQRERSNPST